MNDGVFFVDWLLLGLIEWIPSLIRNVSDRQVQSTRLSTVVWEPATHVPQRPEGVKCAVRSLANVQCEGQLVCCVVSIKRRGQGLLRIGCRFEP